MNTRPILIGSSDFREMIETKSEFVDKTSLISELIHTPFKIGLITRPRRFGKTLNMSMIHHFFAPSIDGRSTTGLFDGLHISQTPDFIKQGKSQVIYLSFHGIKFLQWEQAYNTLKTRFSDLFFSKEYLLHSPKVSDEMKKDFMAIKKRQADGSVFAGGLYLLCHMIYLHHGIRPWILMDEYDSPILAGAQYGYYDEVIGFMRPFFESAFKDNSYLEKGVITGVLRVAKEGLFSGLNNLSIFSVLSSSFATSFGFTQDEVINLLNERNMTSSFDTAKTWYNGYLFGNQVIYNPWSILNFIQTKGLASPYWVNTSDNFLIKNLIAKADQLAYEKLYHLLRGETLVEAIFDHITFEFLQKDVRKLGTQALWILLITSGYLKASEVTNKTAKIAVPNHEVQQVLEDMIALWLSDGIGSTWSESFIQMLINNNIEGFEARFLEILLKTTSFFDTGMQPETFYHGLMLGLFASLEASYEVLSNRESGYGRYDILLKPKVSNKPTIIFELKIASKQTIKELKLAALEALNQIDMQKYTTNMIEPIIKVGVGFKGKKLKVLVNFP